MIKLHAPFDQSDWQAPQEMLQVGLPLWTDPWDGKQKVMERRQPPARVGLLPPGVTAGAGGKWSFNPGPTAELGANLQRARPLTQNSINVDAGGLARAIAAQVADDMAQELAAVQAKARAALAAAQITVGCLVRIKNEPVGSGWNKVIARVEGIDPDGEIYCSVESCNDSCMFRPDHFDKYLNNHGWAFSAGHYDLVEAAAPKELRVGGQARVKYCCSFSSIWGQVFRVLKIDVAAGLAAIDYDDYVLALSSLEPL